MAAFYAVAALFNMLTVYHRYDESRVKCTAGTPFRPGLSF